MYSISAHAPVIEAARLLDRHQLQYVQVVDNDRMIGILTDRDLIRAIASGTFQATSPVVACMNTFLQQPGQLLNSAVSQSLWPGTVGNLLNGILNNAIASIKSFHFHRDLHWDNEYWSAGCEALFGYTADEFMADDGLWLSRVPAADRETVIRASFDDILAERSTIAEYRFRHKDGSLRWIMAALRSQRAEVGDYWIVTVVAVDITARKQAEAALAQSEAQYRLLFESNPNPMWISDAETLKFLAVNSAAVLHYGYSEAEFLTMTLADIHLAADVPTLVASLSATFPHQSEWRHRKKNGELIRVSVTAHEIQWNDRPARFALSQDVTVHRQAEEEIHFQAELLNQIRNAVICTDLHNRIIYWNHFAETLYQWTAAEAIGKPLNFLVPDDQKQMAAQHMDELRQGQSIDTEYILQRKDGTIFPALVSVMPLRNGQGEMIGLLGVSIDISDRKQTEIQLQASLQEKEILLQEIHHRIKNNLQLVTSLLHLQSELTDEPQVQKVLLESWSRIDSMALIHESLYQAQNLSEIDLSDYVRTLADRLLQIYTLNQPIRFRMEATAQIRLDIHRAIPCGLIVNELITNALKYGVEPDSSDGIFVLLETDNTKIRLTVGNRGNTLPLHFDLQQVQSMGLQLVVRLIDQLHGTLEVEAGDPTIFRVTFDPSSSEHSYDEADD